MVLVVVDAQRAFPASSNPIMLETIKNEVISAKTRKLPIMLMQYEGHGPTRAEISNLLRKYPYKYIVHKGGDDGAHELLDELFNLGISTKHYRIMGLNLAHCVKSTLESLSKYAPDARIELVKRGVSCVNKLDFRWTKALPNVTII